MGEQTNVWSNKVKTEDGSINRRSRVHLRRTDEHFNEPIQFDQPDSDFRPNNIRSDSYPEDQEPQIMPTIQSDPAPNMNMDTV